MTNYPKYRDKCMTCRYYDTTPVDRGYRLWLDDRLQYGFECTQKSGNHRLTDSCSYYSEDKYLSDNRIEDVEAFLKKYTSYRFYILSTICEILNLPFDVPFMQAFGKVRDISFTYPNGIKNLYLYDIYGVQISAALVAEYQNEETKQNVLDLINNELMPNYIKLFTDLVMEYGNYQGAIDIYRQMMDYLAQRYQIMMSNETPKLEEINPKKVGFSRKMTLKGML